MIVKQLVFLLIYFIYLFILIYNNNLYENIKIKRKCGELFFKNNIFIKNKLKNLKNKIKYKKLKIREKKKTR
jgi:hypothetical protein